MKYQTIVKNDVSYHILDTEERALWLEKQIKSCRRRGNKRRISTYPDDKLIQTQAAYYVEHLTSNILTFFPLDTHAAKNYRRAVYVKLLTKIGRHAFSYRLSLVRELRVLEKVVIEAGFTINEVEA